jgi:hypothetical protein
LFIQLAQVLMQLKTLQMRIKLYILLIAAALILFAVWMYKSLDKPQPGQEVADLGREHTDDIAGLEYNSMPPTSGTHFPIWAKGGVYDRIISDGYLIHSLEHGYVIISYNCMKSISSFQFSRPKVTKFSSVLAHDEPVQTSTDSGQLLKHMKLSQSEGMSAFTPNNPPDVEIELPETFNSDSCKSLVEKLAIFTDKWDRVIVTPRTDIEKPIVLTAWTRLMNLDSVDDQKIEEFIKTYHNKGPERTVE